jgi:3'-phosphoadenosine 5'-phosphosulfate sulfotransferase
MNSDEETEQTKTPKHYRIRRIYDNILEFKVRFRLSPRLFENLLTIVRENLRPINPTNKALNSEVKLLIFLRFVASNEFYYELQDTQGKS